MVELPNFPVRQKLVDLQARVLARLGEALREARPDVASAFDANIPAASDAAMAAFVAKHRLKAVHPWSPMSTRIFDVRVGIDGLLTGQILLAGATDGCEAWNCLQGHLVATASCVERVEALVKAASRGAPRVLADSVSNPLLKELQAFRHNKAFDELRNGAAHGWHSIPNGYAGRPERSLGWEFMALNAESGDNLNDFYDRCWEQHRTRMSRAGLTAAIVLTMTDKVVMTLLDAI